MSTCDRGPTDQRRCVLAAHPKTGTEPPSALTNGEPALY
eukprot:CAMPEP_0198685616 /NCGR_PEP_ID=MMETSP1468-20131203/13897_1 /TAXON_ID=1461545 /ORGANISM="Mantoniella sp, Strain CCMP1436" /LENGTH=38 /DNA_ID= /DNA_START= /DNA_END= /DNA_ORIENTATION=